MSAVMSRLGGVRVSVLLARLRSAARRRRRARPDRFTYFLRTCRLSLTSSSTTVAAARHTAPPFTIIARGRSARKRSVVARIFPARTVLSLCHARQIARARASLARAVSLPHGGRGGQFCSAGEMGRVQRHPRRGRTQLFCRWPRRRGLRHREGGLNQRSLGGRARAGSE